MASVLDCCWIGDGDLLWGSPLSVWQSPRGGTCENFDRDAHVIFLGLKFTKMPFFWVSLSWRHFFGVDKIAVIFLGSLKICGIFSGY